MKRTAAGFIAALVLALGLTASAETPSLTGAWNMGLQGDHVIPTPLVLKQDGTSLTGTIGLPTQDIGHRVEVKLAGEIANGAFLLSGEVENAKEPTTIKIDGKVTEEGSLEGHINVAGHMNMPWTAERLKERK